MKIGLIKEAKHPVDNRVALAPEQVASLQQRYPDDQFVVQSSDIRAYSDDEYRCAGVLVADSVADCDVLFGIKEADPDILIPDKHYFFFGHIAKMQTYNRPLLLSLMEKGITFSDYEYLVDDRGLRVCAFGWWAGIVGTYYSLRGYGLRHKLYELPKPDLHFTLDKLKQALKSIQLPCIKILVTGNGRVSHGAQELLEEIGVARLTEEQFLADGPVLRPSFCVADVDRLVARNDGQAFTWDHFTHHPEDYHSDFMRWARQADMLICAHFWDPKAPVYLSADDLADPTLRIRFIGDISCDIQGSVKSTLRASTHDEPYYDYNPSTCAEAQAFSADSNITVMAVDTCPNALARDTSAYFGDMLTKHVFTPLLERRHSDVIQRSTILEKGILTPHFQYLETFAKGE
ncbi:MAG: NAD(P)-dependent oxidoreductase [Bacteroidales bacterium]|nr:NAD(P)-dependent oxidoreductase [Bacteroidales bacterium]